MKKYLFFAFCIVPMYLFAQSTPEIVLKRNTKGLTTLKLSLVNKGKVDIDWGDGSRKTYEVNDESRIVDVTAVSEEVKRNAVIKIYGPGIKVFSCLDQFITLLDVRQAQNLMTLDCGKNYLATIDVSQNKNLRTLLVHANRLKSLDISQNGRLSYLNCSYNYLKALDVSHNANLSVLNFSDNLMDKINLGKQKALRSLSLSGNKFKALEVKDFANIKFLDLTYNRFNACALNSIYSHLPEKKQEGDSEDKKISLLVANNKGIVASKTSIVTQKGWTVDVEGKGASNCL